jgi:hypothetical protein
MSEEILNQRYQIRAYLDSAYRSLDAAALNLDNDFYATAINRAYYAIFLVLTFSVGLGIWWRDAQNLGPIFRLPSLKTPFLGMVPNG